MLVERTCASCATSFPLSAAGQIDMRPQTTVTRNVVFEVDPVDPLWSAGQQDSDDDAIEPEPMRVSTYIPSAPAGGGHAIEIGCGENSLRAQIESAGWTYLGVDYRAAGADVLVDVHALPLATGTFSLVVCSALLEHVRYPSLAIREIARVTSAGGSVIGAVAFLQPFHDSYFHMTHAAVRDSFRGAGLELTAIGRTPERFLPYLAMYSGLPRPYNLLIRALVAPADLVHTLLLKLKQAIKKRRHDHSIDVSVGIVFAATKVTTSQGMEKG